MIKTIKRIAIITFLSILLTACFGDKNTLIGKEFGDTSFISKEFTKNKVEFSALPKNMCAYISEAKIKELYPNAKKILFDDGKTFQTKNCRFLVYMDDGKYDYLSGAIFALETNLGTQKNDIKII